MIPRTVLEALTARPVGFLSSAWPWRSIGYLLAGGVPGVAGGVAAGGIAASWDRIGPVAAVVCAGLVLTVLVALAGPFERRRLRLVAPDARPARSSLREPAGWRELGWGALSVLTLGWVDLAVLFVAVGIPGVLLSAPWQPSATPWASVGGVLAGLVLLPVAAYPIAAWAGARSAVAIAVLGSRDAELTEVRRSRARLVDAFEAEQRRIERDLHDGAQQRLVALTMKLGLAALDLPPDSRAAREVAEAHTMAREALAELRELIRGVHPQVLTERGLPAAIRDVAGRSPVPVDTDVQVTRLPASVEVAAYFAVCEALANAARHSGAERCRVHGRIQDEVLVLEVADDGRGGADPAAGSGLTGLADRVAAVDGRMLLSSPIGGPTLVRVEIPCGVCEW
ncbi:sensor histidine kinase [Embleya sp. NBC_00888]|uniref:sensor histidine kinase n=1 Tax=Embleya sp. NBC_00888 TaxID=2975960 RepID=UPI00386575D4|nr:sensor histidine kinase [Embleya sp. NBC_00888]